MTLEELRTEHARVTAWSTSHGCPADCDRTYSSGHQGGWASDHYGACRHGRYTGGSGIDWMCGTCEGMSREAELGEIEDMIKDATTSWAPEVLVEGKWAGNALRFATEDEADRYSHGLLMRWFVPTDSRAVPSDDPINYRLTADGQIEAVA